MLQLCTRIILILALILALCGNIRYVRLETDGPGDRCASAMVHRTKVLPHVLSVEKILRALAHSWTVVRDCSPVMGSVTQS